MKRTATGLLSAGVIGLVTTAGLSEARAGDVGDAIFKRLDALP
jgi:hypothetical protein